MKTYKNLFEKICDFRNLLDSFKQAAKCKRYRPYTLEFNYDLEANLLKLQDELLNQTYRHGGYHEFYVHDPKKRKISAAPFRDRVVHHALCNVIEPIFDRTFIYDSYACRVGKGTHKGIDRLRDFLRERERERERERVVARFIGQDVMSLNATSGNTLKVSTIKFYWS